MNEQHRVLCAKILSDLYSVWQREVFRWIKKWNQIRSKKTLNKSNLSFDLKMLHKNSNILRVKITHKEKTTFNRQTQQIDKFQNLSAEKKHLALMGYRSIWTRCTNANGQCFLQSSWPHLQAETLSTKALVSIFLTPDLPMFTFWLLLWMLEHRVNRATVFPPQLSLAPEGTERF